MVTGQNVPVVGVKLVQVQESTTVRLRLALLADMR